MTKIISKDEMQYNSKLATHNALINLGKIQNKQEIDFSNYLNIKDKLSRILKEYPEDFNNNKKCSNNYLFLNNIINLTKTFFKLNNNYILYLENNINKLNKDRDDFQNDLKENINELIDFEETIEKYWKPRVDKLRNKCITKNKYIKYFKILLVTSNTITFVITIYLTKKNYLFYLAIIIDIFFYYINIIYYYFMNYYRIFIFFFFVYLLKYSIDK